MSRYVERLDKFSIYHTKREEYIRIDKVYNKLTVVVLNSGIIIP
jgi:hypothetical protein